jgi:tRNA pseudouridine55 synthase
LARAGEEVVLESRAVTVHELAIKEEEDPYPTLSRKRERERNAGAPLLPPAGEGWDEGLASLTLSARVSKGTYIRSLARDIARALGTVGHVTMLRRTKAGPFTLESAISLDILDEAAKGRTLEQALLPLTAGLDDIPALSVTPDQAGALRQGRRLIGISAKPGLHLATDASVPVALVELSEGELRVVRGFNL